MYEEMSEAVKYASFTLASFQASTSCLPIDDERTDRNCNRTYNRLCPSRDIRAGEIGEEAELIHRSL